MNDFADECRKLLEEQSCSWDTLRRNREILGRCETRIFNFDGDIQVICQFNPARIYSVSAKVDRESIRNRDCFLCDRNRPIEQKSLDCGNDYKLLCNPFPIVPEHFTLVHKEHRPQLIGNSIGEMLDLAKLLASRYVVFYNGPECGASAPDHLHFQAGLKKSLPAEVEYDRVKQLIADRDSVRSYISPAGFLRHFIAFESTDANALLERFEHFHATFHKLQPRAIEPMMNLFCSFDGPSQNWRLLIFPRHKHRPSIYYAAEASRMMISPGCVDIAGLIVMPVEADFRRVAKQDIIQTYQEVTFDSESFGQLVRILR